MSIRLNKLAPLIGAEVTGIDLSRPLDAGTASNIAEALATLGVLVFPNQPISDQEHVRFGRHFGELAKFSTGDNPASITPEVFRSANTKLSGELLTAEDERTKLIRINWLWHVDCSYRAIPTKGSILRGIEIIEDAGDTVFANMHAAYEALALSMQNRIGNLLARHSFEFMVSRCDLPPLSKQEAAVLSPVHHPLVRQHPDGWKSLYLSPPYMETIVGWKQDESRALIEELTDLATRDKFIYRHRWRPHDVIMWDNGLTMHRVTSYDLNRQRRVMHGVVMVGEQPIEPVYRAHL
jgi:taurine dioxygenase